MVTVAAPVLVDIRCKGCGKFFFQVKPEHEKLVWARIFIKCYRCHHEQGGIKPEETLHP